MAATLANCSPSAMRCLPLHSAFLVAALIAITAPAVAQEIVYPAAGSIGMVPPAPMVAADGFTGFTDSESGGSIVIAELPGDAYAQVEGAFTGEQLAAKRFIVDSPPIALTLADGVRNRLLKGSQSANGISYRKWALIAGTTSVTALITVQIPEDATGYSDAAILAALQSARFRAPAGIEEQLAALPFVIGDRADFIVEHTLAGSAAVLADAAPVPAGHAKTGIVVAAAIGKTIDPVDPEAAAANLAKSLDFKDLVFTTRAQSDGAWISSGKAGDPQTGRAIRFVQTVRFESGRYVRVIAFRDAEAASSLDDRFARLAASVALKPR